MMQLVEHISAKTKSELEQIKQDLKREFDDRDIPYSIIDSDWNSELNGYKAQVNYWI